MNRWIFYAGLVSGATFFIHLIGGEPGFHIPALQSNLNAELKSLLSVIWHGTTAMLALNSLALLWASKHGDYKKPVVLLIVGQYASLAFVFIFYGLLRHGSLIPMPQWTILFVVAGLALAGLGEADKIASES